MTNFIFNKTLIIGLGLMGGSIAKAFKKHHIAKEIYAIDTNFTSLELAIEDGIIIKDFSLENDFRQFDLIAICAPLNQYQKIFTKLYNNIDKNSVVFDIGSVKNFKFNNIPQNFIACHPIAGSQLSGYENSNADLFLQKKFIICPQKNNPKKNNPQKNNSGENKNDVEQEINSKKMFDVAQKIGAIPQYLEPSLHDKIYALTSHLPQFLSFLCSEFSPQKNDKKIDNKFLATAFRLDESNPEIWQDIFRMNELNLEYFYETFLNNLEKNLENIDKFNLKNCLQQQGLKDLDLSIFIDQNIIFDKNFEIYFEKNFSALFFRLLMALSLLEIPQIKTYYQYIGEGFKDFISIINITKLDESLVQSLIIKNRHKIFQHFDNITN